METLHNQELVATILEDNVASELTTIQDFLRWTYSTFNRSDIYYGQGHDNAWDESLQLVLAGLHYRSIYHKICLTVNLLIQKKKL